MKSAKTKDGKIAYSCQCGHYHYILIEGPKSWVFNQNFEAPTLSPSVLVKNNNGYVCHSFVKDGQIQFLSDCSHEFKNQTLPMLDLPQNIIDNAEAYGLIIPE